MLVDDNEDDDDYDDDDDEIQKTCTLTSMLAAKINGK